MSFKTFINERLLNRDPKIFINPSFSELKSLCATSPSQACRVIYDQSTLFIFDNFELTHHDAIDLLNKEHGYTIDPRIHTQFHFVIPKQFDYKVMFVLNGLDLTPTSTEFDKIKNTSVMRSIMSKVKVIISKNDEEIIEAFISGDPASIETIRRKYNI